MPKKCDSNSDRPPHEPRQKNAGIEPKKEKKKKAQPTQATSNETNGNETSTGDDA